MAGGVAGARTIGARGSGTASRAGEIPSQRPARDRRRVPSGRPPRLLALTHHRPLLSPQGVADALALSVAGASKLLERAVAADLLVEITQRRSWRLFLPPDLAVEFGYAASKRGRPAKEPSLPASRNLAVAFDAFDEEMAAIDKLLTSARGTKLSSP
ncbi:hypothetical protein [Novosphingobium panipatense]|uniref:hypothetical protein n=1 Tax=Novosphingobium panipatense TaxID=428991 RepID=UPI00360F692C